MDEPITSYPDPAPPNQNDGSNVMASWGYKDNLLNMWEDEGLDVLLPGVLNFNFLPAIEVGDPLPTTGNPGDILYERVVGTESVNNYYAWDPALGEFTTAFYAVIDNVIGAQMRGRRDAHAKAANEAFLSSGPFVWATLYMPEYRVVKDLL